MEFNDTLVNISENVDFEKQIWEEFKPYLTEIAKKDHPYGCVVIFQNFKDSFYKAINDIIKKDIIFSLPFFIDGLPSFSYSHSFGRVLIWNKKSKDKYSRLYVDISSYILIVTNTDDKINFEIRELNKDEKSASESLYHLEERYFFT